jgi:selenide, water dikinase
MNNSIKLTQYSHGAGCGCKISPKVLDQILHSEILYNKNPHLLVGNETRDDAAVFDLGNGTAVISTTDFFMPIVDDPYSFGKIASVNAISDIYAMGGTPLMAIAVLGWPIDQLSPDVARAVIEGSREVCAEAGIPLAGGHSIDNKEPLFGLAVTGTVKTKYIKQNAGGTEGCQLFLTKPLGVGLYTTAQKRGMLATEDLELAVKWMQTLNKAGAVFGKMPYVKALTDVTGFGLLGHLIEMCEGSGLSAEIDFSAIPQLEKAAFFIDQKCMPGGTNRNWDSYGHKVAAISDFQRALLADPQTSGGLLVAVDKRQVARFRKVAAEQCGMELQAIGQLVAKKEKSVYVS